MCDKIKIALYKLEFIVQFEMVGPLGRQHRKCGAREAPSDEGAVSEADWGRETQVFVSPSVKNRFRSADFCQLPRQRELGRSRATATIGKIN